MNTEEKIEPMDADEKRLFNLANDIEFYDACMDFEDGIPTMRKNRPLQTIGDRIRLIKCLEKHGFTIVKH